MGKQGPCRHCGTNSTPLWRNGPPDKPVLCNACGSRWRTKGSLANYLPLLTRDLPGSEDTKVPKLRSTWFKSNEHKTRNKKLSNGAVEVNPEMLHYTQSFPKGLDEDTSNRSSSGSAISYSESCGHVGTADANELTASAQSNAWDTLVPSKKRTNFTRPRNSHVEKLRKDLCSILHEQELSYISGTSEEDLIFGSEPTTGSIEIVNGGVLFRIPNSKNSEEESEASSFTGHGKSSVTSKGCSGSTSFLIHSESKTRGANVSSEKVKKSTTQVGQDHMKRDRFSRGNQCVPQGKNPSLTAVVLKDVISFETFTEILSHEEQQQLMKYLPPVDTAKSAKSLRSMFYSSQFLDTISDFQGLTSEGLFSLSAARENTVEYRTLKRLVLYNLTKSRWVEEYHKQRKDGKLKENTCEKEIDTMLNIQKQTDILPIKRPLDTRNHNFLELNTMRSPKISLKSGGVNQSTNSFLPNSSNAGYRATGGAEDILDDEEASFCARSLFAFPPESSSMLASLQFTNDSSVQDLLIDMSFNCSFPQAELLVDPSKERKVPSSSSMGSGISVKEQASRSSVPSSSCGS